MTQKKPNKTKQLGQYQKPPKAINVILSSLFLLKIQHSRTSIKRTLLGANKELLYPRYVVVGVSKVSHPTDVICTNTTLIRYYIHTLIIDLLLIHTFPRFDHNIDKSIAWSYRPDSSRLLFEAFFFLDKIELSSWWIIRQNYVKKLVIAQLIL